MTLSEQFHRTSAWIDAHSPRERIMLFIIAVSVVFFVWNEVLFSPLSDSLVSTTQRISAVIAKTQMDQQRIVTIIREEKTPPNPVLIRERNQLQVQIKTLDSQIETASSNMIPPSEVPKVLERLLSSTPGLTIDKLSNVALTSALPKLPPNKTSKIVQKVMYPPVAENSSAASKFFGSGGEIASKKGAKSEEATSSAISIPQLYEHHFVLVMTGEYFSLIDYLRLLENSSWRLFMDSLDYQVKKYPDARIEIKLHTLSSKESLFNE